MSITIRTASKNDLSMMLKSFSKNKSTFELYLQEQIDSEREIWVAEYRNMFAGYVTLKKNSEYEPFKVMGIPEIKDLNVLPQYRKLGIATKLINEAERAASAISDVVGIGVGLFKDYGPAQRLYIKLGYMPDGRGAYNDKHVLYGEKVLIDDDFCLFLVKSLNGSA